MIDHNADRYGPEFVASTGWIVELGEDVYQHRFGGSSWQVVDPNAVYGDPTLLLNLDLTDPRLVNLTAESIDALPLCSYINCDAWLSTQLFQIDPESKIVTLVSCQIDSPYQLENEDKFLSPLPERYITLRPMRDDEIPANEILYWKACDSFLGGSAFIRVGGPPVWLQNVEVHKCTCGLPMDYVCGIGYENYDKPAGFVPNKAFFIGEAGLYFFLCKTCLKVAVTSQPS
jgi:hypothetical protein